MLVVQCRRAVSLVVLCISASGMAIRSERGAAHGGCFHLTSALSFSQAAMLFHSGPRRPIQSAGALRGSQTRNMVANTIILTSLRNTVHGGKPVGITGAAPHRYVMMPLWLALRFFATDRDAAH